MSSPTTTLSPAASAAAAEASAIMHAIKHKGEHVRSFAVASNKLLIWLMRTNQDYPKDIWYFLACTVGVAALLNIVSVVWAFWRRQAFRRERALAQSPTSINVGTHGIFHRVANAIISTSRIVAFRLRLPAVRLSVLEALLTAIYLMALLIWTFVNSTSSYPVI